MKKILLFTILFLSLFPLLNISDGSTILAQYGTYENGSNWLPELDVTSNNEICPKCTKLYDPEEGHTCSEECPYCHGRFEDLNYHYKYTFSCANAAGYKEDDKDGDKDGEPNGGSNSGGTGSSYNSSSGATDSSSNNGILPELVVTGKKSSSNNWYNTTTMVVNSPSTMSTASGTEMSENNFVDDAPTDTTLHGQLKAMIDKVFAKIVKSVYPNLSKRKYIARLKELIDNPLKIDQGYNGTCGSAVICKWMLENKPELFINMAAGIYENGAYEINGVYLGVPSGHLWNSWFGEKSWLEVSDADIANRTLSYSVDAIMQGTITNWMNYAVNYNPFEGNCDFTSMALPNRICDFFQEFLGASTMIISDFPSQLTYSGVKDLDFEHNFVIALVGRNQGNSFAEYIPEHYVQAFGVEKDNSGYRLDYWTWGEIDKKTATVDDSQSGIFGLILVK